MDFRLERGIATHTHGDTGAPERQSRAFTAPASPELDNEIKVTVLADAAGTTDRGPEACARALDAIEHYFANTTTVDVFGAIQAAFDAANVAVREDQPAGAECSAAIVVIAGERVFAASAGTEHVILVREKRVKVLTPNRTWFDEARRTWNVAPADMPERIESSSGDYLGSSERVTPMPAPVEFLWPGDTLLICTAALARHLTDSLLRTVPSRAPQEAAAELVDAAVRDGGDGNLTAMVLAFPRATALVPVHNPMTKPIRRHSTIPALIVFNLSLLCLIAVMVMRGGGVGTLFAPSPTIEVARPAFIITPTPLPELDSTADTASDPFAPPPPRASPPALAPTLAPAPTYTPRPLPADWTSPSAPVLVDPSDGFVFGGPAAQVVLSWKSLGDLPEDLFYVVDIRKSVNGKLIGESRNWTKATRIKLDPAFYTAYQDTPGPLKVSAPDLQAPVAQFQWSVAVNRLTLITPDGTLTGVQLSPSSGLRTFLWGPAPVQAPTRVYGTQGMDTDPFFSEQQRREASAAGALAPASAGMGGLSLLLGAIVGVTRIKTRLRRGRSRTRH